MTQPKLKTIPLVPQKGHFGKWYLARELTQSKSLAAQRCWRGVTETVSGGGLCNSLQELLHSHFDIHPLQNSAYPCGFKIAHRNQRWLHYELSRPKRRSVPCLSWYRWGILGTERWKDLLEATQWRTVNRTWIFYFLVQIFLMPVTLYIS